MTTRLHHLPLLALLGGALAVAACSNQPTSTRPSTPAQGASTGTATHAAPTGTATKPSRPTVSVKPIGKPLPESTGIPACDDYLASYVACHRAAAIYTPDQIQPRYEAMRTSLLTDSIDPNVRPQLSARCTGLASQLKQALHGKSCESMAPAPAASSH